MVAHTKLIVVGDGGIGKSCLLIASATGKFPHEYVPTVFGSWVSELRLNGNDYEIALWDTAGQEDYDRLRPMSYPGSDVICICFAVDNRDSFENITEKWIPELQHHIPNVPKMLVACKTDLRYTSTGDYVTYAEGSKVAQDLELRYQETSALTRDGLTACFNRAIIEANQGIVARRRKKDRLQFFRRPKKEIPSPPTMPPAEKAPRVEVEASRFADDWRGVLEKPRHFDVTFILGGGQRLEANKLVLCSSSSFFCRLFGMTRYDQNDQKKNFGRLEPFSMEDMNNGVIKGIYAVYEKGTIICAKGQRRRHTVIKLASDITYTTFTRVLEFLYTGTPNLPDSHNDVNLDAVNDITKVSKIFQMTRLNEICQNYVMDHGFLNTSIGTCLNNDTGQRMKDLYFNNPEYADVAFKVQGQTIYAHKVVLCARCRAMATMFGGQFREGKKAVTEVDIPATSVECFLALLEYLYTDHSPIQEVDVMGLIVLADLYDQKGLMNICELYVTKEVDRSVTKRIEQAEIDVIGLLLTSQMYNANQLTAWCLHFISSNYTAFKRKPEFDQLKGDNLDIVKKRQWPPSSYLEEVAEYDKKWAGNGVECSLM
ncbi:rho-related protein racA-like [Mizuhopecten yessoensis]|nr:rho-related protein racA-like [Mizuhopecten yessoensis]